MNEAGQTVCLCMIVKNERHALLRCLESARRLIDHWIIIDTGSLDATQDLIRDALRDIPGSLIERPWRNFGHNRSESIALARDCSDYLLTLDADEYFDMDADFKWEHLTQDVYDFLVESSGTNYSRIQLVRSSLPWRYEGVLHEYITCDRGHTQARMHGVRTIRLLEGARSRDPLTYRNDSLLLEEAIQQDPTNTRNMFYLAQSYRDASEISNTDTASLTGPTLRRVRCLPISAPVGARCGVLLAGVEYSLHTRFCLVGCVRIVRVTTVCFFSLSIGKLLVVVLDNEVFSEIWRECTARASLPCQTPDSACSLTKIFTPTLSRNRLSTRRYDSKATGFLTQEGSDSSKR
jgi:hypothetical protein